MTQLYNTNLSRNLIYAKADMLEHAMGIEVLGKFGRSEPHPKNSTDTVVFRRLNPYNMAANGTPNIDPTTFVLQEGVTPTPNTISYTDVRATIEQYGVLFRFTSKVQLMYEDDIPGDMKELTGETLAEVQELVRWGIYKAGTSVVYANGASRASVNTALNANKLRLIARQLDSARAKQVNRIVAPTQMYDTHAVSPSFVVLMHSDVESDARQLSNFIPKEKYPSQNYISDREIGAWERFRFITSPLLNPFLAAGSGTLNGMYSVGATNVDVYPVLVIGMNCWATVPLRGFDAISPTLISSRDKNHANPMGQFGYVGADMWFTCLRLNENWMVRFECGVTAL